MTREVDFVIQNNECLDFCQLILVRIVNNYYYKNTDAKNQLVICRRKKVLYFK